MLFELAFVAGVGVLAAVGPAPLADATSPFPRESLFPVAEERAAHLMPAALRERSKKQAWLAEKIGRRPVHVSDQEIRQGVAFAVRATRQRRKRIQLPAGPVVLRPGARVEPVTTLFNIWTREALPVISGEQLETRFHGFLRDHFTNQATQMDTRLVDVLTRVAERFRAARIEVVSGYRSPKYNLMLRKKGREVARTSQHTEGNAVDFRIRGVPTPALLKFVRSLRQGGVGFYPHSRFVHADTGRVRFWNGS